MLCGSGLAQWLVHLSISLHASSRHRCNGCHGDCSLCISCRCRLSEHHHFEMFPPHVDTVLRPNLGTVRLLY